MIKIILILILFIIQIQAEYTINQFNELCSTKHPDQFGEYFINLKMNIKNHVQQIIDLDQMKIIQNVLFVQQEHIQRIKEVDVYHVEKGNIQNMKNQHIV